MRFDVEPFARFFVVSVNVAVLVSRIDNVGIGGFDGLKKTVAAKGCNPFGGGYSLSARILRRPSEAVVILSASVNPIEGLGVVNTDAVKLCNGQISFEEEIFSRIEGFINTAVATDHKMFCVVRIDPHGMVVHMTVFVADGFPCFSAVNGNL